MNTSYVSNTILLWPLCEKKQQKNWNPSDLCLKLLPISSLAAVKGEVEAVVKK